MRAIVASMAMVALTVLLMTQAVPAQGTVDIKKELETAVFHAGELAQRGTAIAGTRSHLQHVINCLEGSKGKDFNPAPGHVCQGQGNGIIPDLKASSARGAAKALQYSEIALTLSLQAIKFSDVDEAQPWAKVISNQLKIALDAFGR